VIYTEEIPTDVMTRHIDGAYTAAVTMSLARGIACPIHLTRFALPDFKTIQLISEHGIGDNLPAVRATFFNGEALYLSGDSTVFSRDCLALIRKTHGILREHADAFTSLEPMPLVSTLSPAIHANRFPSKGKCVWTLMNGQLSDFEGPVLSVPHRAGSRYLDAWNGGLLTPDITADGRAVLSLALDAGGVGCIVQTW
jgi:hypothetical protein